MLKILLLTILILNTGIKYSNSQNDGVNNAVVWSTWTMIQTIPSPVFYQDKNSNESRLQLGLRWNISPVNYSFNANPLVSPISVFKVNPVRRFGGSIEIFSQPEWLMNENQFSDLKRFSLSNGIRLYLPAIESGEYLAFSIAGKYKIRKDKSGSGTNCFSAEAGIYSFFGILGIQFNYNFESRSRYDVGLWLKYY